MQTKWVNNLSGQPFIEMVKIPAGNFTMGSNSSFYSSEKPERNVFLHDYYIAKYPITNKQFFHFLQETNYNSKGHNFLQHWGTNSNGSKFPPKELLDHPVVYVNWMDCYAFCKTYGLTLPTEAQWEKAARGTDHRTFPWGNDELDTSKPRCNFSNLFNTTTPVGTFDGSKDSYNGIPIQKGSSPYGVEDMAGNVWEWCLDEWDSKWLENMGDNPIDPCVHQKPTRRGLTLAQIKSFLIQKEAEEQLPFLETEFCGAVRGSTSVPPTSAPPIATTSTRRTGTSTTACVVASKEEEVEKQSPFLETEFCGAVRGSTAIPPSSAPPFDSTSIRRTGTTSSGCVVASKEEEVEKQIPFLETECCGAVRGSTAIPPSSAPPFASTTTRRAGTTSSALDVASEQEAEEQRPFLETEFCEAVRGTSAILSTSMPPVASTASTRCTGTTTLVSESASEKQETENEPFSRNRVLCGGSSISYFTANFYTADHNFFTLSDCDDFIGFRCCF